MPVDDYSSIVIVHNISGVIGGAEKVFIHTLIAAAELDYQVHGFLTLGNKYNVARIINMIQIDKKYKNNIYILYSSKDYIIKKYYRLQNLLVSMLAKYAILYRYREPRLCINTKAEDIPFTACSNTIYYVHGARHLPGCCRAREKSAKYRAENLLKKPVINSLLKGYVVANSEFTQRQLTDYLGVKPLVIHPPVDTEELRKCSISDKKNQIICIGRLVPTKRHELCIFALSRLKGNYTLKIIGNKASNSDKYIEFLRRLSEKYNVRNRVRIIANAPRNVLYRELCNASVLLHPMRGEPFGIAVVEAMAAGTVPVVWNYGGPAYIVPKRFQFSNLGEMIEKLRDALFVPRKTRNYLRRLSLRYDTRVFRERIKVLIRSVVYSSDANL